MLTHLSLLPHFDALQELATRDAGVLSARLKDRDRLVEHEVGDDEPACVTVQCEGAVGFMLRELAAQMPAFSLSGSKTEIAWLSMK